MTETPTNATLDSDRVTVKRCARCQQVKPLDVEHFQRHAAHADRFSSWCRDCDKDRDRRRYRTPYRRAYKRALVANKRAVRGKLSPDDVLHVTGDRCYWCGELLDDDDRVPSLDHVRPLTRGGANVRANVVMACRSCNARKGDKPLQQWLAQLAARGKRHHLMSPSMPVQLTLDDVDDTGA